MITKEGDMKDYKNPWLAEQRKNKEVRKQVCDEIRKKFGYKYNNQLMISSKRLLEFLDKIEGNDNGI